MNPPLKLYFYSLILTNNNILLKIYCENIIIAFLNWYFLFFILFFLSFLKKFHSSSFFFFFPSYFSPSHTYTHISPSSLFLLYFPLDSRTSLSLSFSSSLAIFSSVRTKLSLFPIIPNFQFDSIPAHFLENHHSSNHFSI